MFEEPIEFNNLHEAEAYYRDIAEYRNICTKLYEKYNYNSKLEIVSTRKVVKQYTHLFITINPPPTLKLDIFINTINKTLSKNWIEGYIYVIEQRGENEEELGKGFHTHILIKLFQHKKQSEINREIKNTWKKILDIDNYHILNIKFIDDAEQKRKQGYILGEKAEEIKHLKQKMDIIYREKNNLQKYYYLDYIIEDKYGSKETI